LRTDDPLDIKVTADDLLATAPVTLESRVLRSTVRLMARNGNGIESPFPSGPALPTAPDGE